MAPLEGRHCRRHRRHGSARPADRCHCRPAYRRSFDAHRLVTDVLPRLESLLTAQGRGRPQVPAARQKPGGDGHFIARVGGRPLALSRRGPDVVISWGEEMQKAAQASVTRPDRSVASICDGWMRTGKIPPSALVPSGRRGAGQTLWESIPPPPRGAC